MKIPTIWQHLRPGDRVFSARPYHSLQAAAAVLADKFGITVEFEPAPGGYWIHCLEAK